MRFIYSKTFIIFFSCLAGVVLLLVMQTRGWLEPLKTALLHSPRPVVYVIRGVTTPVKSFFVNMFTLKRIAEENTELEEKVRLLQQDLVDYEQEKRENEALRKELGFVKTTKQQNIPCTVLSRNPLGLSDTIILNCGEEDGVEEGRAVVSGGYLVGKVIYVNKNSSTAILITGSKFTTDVKLSKTGAGAVAAGSFGTGIVLDQLSQNAAVEKGWLVVTAGINEKIPKNILVGEVGDTLSTPNDLFKKISLFSPVDFNALQFVYVVK